MAGALEPETFSPPPRTDSAQARAQVPSAVCELATFATARRLTNALMVFDMPFPVTS